MQLETVGFKDLGVKRAQIWFVLRRTKMPAILVEVGFINSDSDNTIFDKNFNDIAQAIADGIPGYAGRKKGSGNQRRRNSSTASESGRTSSVRDTSASVSPADGSTKSNVWYTDKFQAQSLILLVRQTLLT